MMRKLKRIIGILLILVGIGIYAYPTIMEWQMEKQTEKIIQEFNETYHVTINNGSGETEETEENSDDVDPLYQAMVEYNQDLIENGQELTDAWSYQQETIDLSDYYENTESTNGAIGYIEIPDMDVTLPLYLGADTANLAKGAAVLSETSMPIGGESTNCVIAGHRGYQGMPYFRNIEMLTIGSLVYVTNPWETMTYEVSEIQIINPNDVDSILIQEGRDLVTLITCHPYMSGGKYRYIVYCERVSEETENNEVEENAGSAVTIKTGGDLTEVGSSTELIETEQAIRIIVLITIILCLIIAFKPKKKNKDEGTQNEQLK